MKYSDGFRKHRYAGIESIDTLYERLSRLELKQLIIMWLNALKFYQCENSRVKIATIDGIEFINQL